MILSFLTLLLGGTVLVSQVSAAEQAPLSPQEYIKKTYLSPSKDTPLLQHTYGDPSTSRAVLLVFSSLTCPTCNLFHTKILPQLEDAIKKMTLSVIVRDYPADPLSLKASSIIWANGSEKAKDLEKSILASQMKWIKESEEKSLEELNALVANSSLTPEEKATATKAASDRVWLEKIFTHRNKDKKALDIEHVPAAWLILKNKQDSQHYDLIEIKDIKDLEALRSLLQEKTEQISR